MKIGVAGVSWNYSQAFKESQQTVQTIQFSLAEVKNIGMDFGRHVPGTLLNRLPPEAFATPQVIEEKFRRAVNYP